MTIEIMKDKLLKYKEEKYYFSKFDFSSNSVEYKRTSRKDSSNDASKTIPVNDIECFFIYRTTVVEGYRDKHNISNTGGTSGSNMRASYKDLYRFSMFIEKKEYILDEVITEDLHKLRKRTAELVKSTKKRIYYKLDKSITLGLSKNDPNYLYNLLFRDSKAISYREYNELDIPYYKLIKQRNEPFSFTNDNEIQIEQGQTTTVNFKRDFYSSETGKKSIKKKVYDILALIIALSLGYFSTQLIHLKDIVASIAIAFGVTVISYMIITIGFIQTILSKKHITAQIIIDNYNIKYNEGSIDSIEENMDINEIMEIVLVDDNYIKFFLKDRLVSIEFYGGLGKRVITAINYACLKHFK